MHNDQYNLKSTGPVNAWFSIKVSNVLHLLGFAVSLIGI